MEANNSFNNLKALYKNTPNQPTKFKNNDGKIKVNKKFLKLSNYMRGC